MSDIELAVRLGAAAVFVVYTIAIIYDAWARWKFFRDGL